MDTRLYNILTYLLIMGLTLLLGCSFADEGPETDTLWNVAVSRSGAVTFKTDSLDCGRPWFCRDDSMIVYLQLKDRRSTQAVQSRLVVASVGGVEQLSTMKGFEFGKIVGIGPDTRWAIVSLRSEELYRVDLESGSTTFLSTLTGANDLSLAPDGASLVCVEWEGIVQYTLPAMNRTVLFPAPPPSNPSPFMPLLLPNGDLVFVRDSLSLPSVYVLHPGSGAPVLLDRGTNPIGGKRKNVVAFKNDPSSTFRMFSLESGQPDDQGSGNGEPVQFLYDETSLLVKFSTWGSIWIAWPGGTQSIPYYSEISGYGVSTARDSTLITGLVEWNPPYQP